ncbi:glutathione-disulfide reductase [Trichocoleus sp. FACHB-591]|uniref:glutathione-disulfide reductase n=1 Tax=Trichocoleus sp. FACHB-591 TaxID=2692872 RepID=UPI00168355D0|nr:glutathione-disulfide reductase [Trichocoleus sp. FACHB-591]MBD2096597.1 glutathione-disulfide reductase [Trichocoleus sp. FACHB-591]
MAFDYDLLVIGAGSGGLAAAERATTYGARVAIAELAAVGGTCVNHGCVPERLLNYAASFADVCSDAAGYGWNTAPSSFSWAKFVQAKNQQIEKLHQVHQRHLDSGKIAVISGQAVFVDAHTLQVGEQSVTAAKILISAGAEWDQLPIPGAEHLITSRELFNLPELPQRLAIIGDNYIGVKSASSLNSLGSQVFQVIPSDSILADCDHELASAVQAGLARRGVSFRCHSQLLKVERSAAGLELTLSDRDETLTVDVVVAATQRHPKTQGLKLEKAGVQLTAQGTVAADEYSRTTQPNIFAIGDCTSRTSLTPVAIASGRAMADTEFGPQPHAVDYNLIPVSVGFQPEAATVGLSEAQARTQFGEAVQCYRTEIRPLSQKLTPRHEPGLLKLVVEAQSQRVVGAHLIGEHATEIIQCLAIAMRLGVTKPQLNQTMGLHPSIAEELINL